MTFVHTEGLSLGEETALSAFARTRSGRGASATFLILLTSSPAPIVHRPGPFPSLAPSNILTGLFKTLMFEQAI